MPQTLQGGYLRLQRLCTQAAEIGRERSGGVPEGGEESEEHDRPSHSLDLMLREADPPLRRHGARDHT